MLISESSYIHVQRPLVIHDLLGFRHFFFYQRIKDSLIMSYIHSLKEENRTLA